MEKKQKHFLHRPEYKGGPKALSQFIHNQLRYPEAALAERVEGVVMVEADIDHRGRVVDTRVLQSLGHGCDEEAVRVVQQVQFEVAKNRGVRVLFHQRFNVQFKLPKPAPAPIPVPAPPQVITNYQYTMVPATPQTADSTPESNPPDTSHHYTYTITLN